MLIGRSLQGSARFAALIALALLMKALVPAGWMPVFDNGTIALRLCGGWAPVPAPVQQPAAESHHGMAMDHAAAPPSSHHDRHEEQRQGADQPCAFAAAALSWTAPDPAAAPEYLLRSAALSAPRPSAVATGRGLAAPPPPQTGPPLLT